VNGVARLHQRSRVGHRASLRSAPLNRTALPQWTSDTWMLHVRSGLKSLRLPSFCTSVTWLLQYNIYLLYSSSETRGCCRSSMHANERNCWPSHRVNRTDQVKYQADPNRLQKPGHTNTMFCKVQNQQNSRGNRVYDVYAIFMNWHWCWLITEKNS